MKVAPDPEFDLALCRKVKARVPDGFLWADANCGYDVDTALAVAPKLADAGRRRARGAAAAESHRRLPGAREAGARLPILMDEGIVSADELVEFIRLAHAQRRRDEAGALRRTADGAAANRDRPDAGLMWLASGLTDPDVSLAATLALFSSMGQDAALRAERSAVPRALGRRSAVRPEGRHAGAAAGASDSALR